MKKQVKAPRIVINGCLLPFSHAMTLSVAISSFLLDMRNPDALGTDDQGRQIAKGYKKCALQIQNLMLNYLESDGIFEEEQE